MIRAEHFRIKILVLKGSERPSHPSTASRKHGRARLSSNTLNRMTGPCRSRNPRPGSETSPNFCASSVLFAIRVRRAFTESFDDKLSAEDGNQRRAEQIYEVFKPIRVPTRTSIHLYIYIYVYLLYVIDRFPEVLILTQVNNALDRDSVKYVYTVVTSCSRCTNFVIYVIIR
jgi:hypothetical protein